MAKQLSIVDHDNKPIAPLHDAAVAYADVRDKRISATKVEVEHKNTVLELMNQHELQHYEDDGVLIDVVAKELKLKVRIADPDE